MIRFSIILFVLIFQISCSEKKNLINENWDNGFPKIRVEKTLSPAEGEFRVVKSYEKEDSNSCIFEQYYDNGQLESKGKIFYGEKDGLWLSWYRNGQKSQEENYKKGTRVGLYRSWFKDGKELEVIEYK